MKILHTSDWHIGKKLIKKERYEEYRAVLGEIADICRDEKVDLCLVAGDVFDTYTPSAEAESVFFEAVYKIAKSCAVLIISGNHDDYVRLTASSALSEANGIYIVGNNLRAVSCGKTGNCYPVESGEGYAVFQNAAGEKVFINTLPYPNEARFKEGKTDESFADKISRWASVGEKGRKSGIPSIFLSHLFVLGGKACESEREIDLGGTRLVPLNCLPICDYIALGHLHKRQKIGENAYYSGSVMRLSFDESQSVKSVNLFDLTENGVQNFEQRALKTPVELIRLQALSVQDGLNLLDMNPNAYAELTLNLSEPLTREQIALLSGRQNLVLLKTEVESARIFVQGESRKGKSAGELFTDYYQARFSAPPSEKLMNLFLEMTEEK